MLCAASDVLRTKRDVLVFSNGMLAILCMLAVVHYNYTTREREEGLAHVIRLLLLDKAPWLGEFSDAVFVDSFENLSDAMGYVIVEAWYSVISVRERKTHSELITFFKISAVIVLVTFVLETAEHLSKRSRAHAVFSLLSKVVVSGGAWFLATPLMELWLRLFQVGPNDGPSLFVILLSVLVGIAWQHFVSFVLQYSYRFRNKKNDLEELGAFLGEDLSDLTKQAMFYTSARLAKARVVAFSNYLGIHSVFSSVLWTFYAVAVVMVIEYFTSLPPLSDVPASRVRMYKLRAESGAMYCRALAWMDSGFLTVTIGAYFRDTPLSFFVQAIVAQAISILVERFRLLRLLKVVTQIEDLVQREEVLPAEELQLLAHHDKEDDAEAAGARLG
eukprot:TRINITY_DN27395_c0_g1_i1.p1 TRINITY_DN27395_c0_g1~~TRINITY_DN27395_c0_g1_i1.p1  ORF type:complete len:446 (-),score=57.43 TRINITY_DN27395_c0_g1_i1:149-1312(-)